VYTVAEDAKKEKNRKIRPKNWSKMAQNRKKVPRKIRSLKPPTDFISRHETHPDVPYIALPIPPIRQLIFSFKAWCSSAESTGRNFEVFQAAHQNAADTNPGRNYPNSEECKIG
jgi:hypothetical protein